MTSIERFRIWLDNNGIDYERDDWYFDTFQIERVKIPSCENCKLSVVQGYGTWGNENDLLESWAWNEEEPHGNKTLHEVIKEVMEVLF